MGQTCLAADLMQDTFVRILSKPELPELDNPRRYLLTVASGLLKNHWRRQALEKAYLEALAQTQLTFSPSPEQRHEALEMLLEIARLLEGLPVRTREIFLLSQLDEMTYPQIAQTLGVSVNVVQKSMTKAVSHCYRVMYA